MPSRTLLSVFVVALLLAPVGSALAAPATTGASTSAATSPSAPAASVSTPVAQSSGHNGTAENETIGYFDGYWYDSNITVNQDDGLSDAETRAYVRRTMARVEVLRQHNFKHAVPVDVMSRSAYQANQSRGASNSSHSQWNQQVWEAALVIGSNTNLSAAMQSYYSNNVLGFYSPSSDAIKIIVPSGKQAYMEYSTLSHELQHALQDQYYNLSSAKYGGETQDTQLATSGLVEGEARYVESKYEEKCESGEWDCVAGPSSASVSGSSSSTTTTTTTSQSSSASASPPLSLRLTLYFPYASGPGYVHTLIQQGGWAAVDEAWATPPNTTTEVIHGEAPATKPVSVDRDVATNGWKTFPNQGVNGTDTLGEASAFMGLWWQGFQFGANAVPKDAIRSSGEYRAYHYSAAATTGWAGDKVLPYHKSGKYGFVWKSRWTDASNASAFADAYVLALKAHDATKQNGAWVVTKQDGYQGAYRVVQNGDTVAIVNGPDVAAVNDIRPSLAGNESASPTTTTSSTVPGFGALAGLVALAALVVALRITRRR
ncbi:Hvo_1808 family surface protein [Halarchaeum sp. P4]|uniref:Hvo_1808 family surface protein n=1 Tax=Halarchaeum sp. P4 TaxID=3421639 RepID=UPI003EBC58CF